MNLPLDGLRKILCSCLALGIVSWLGKNYTLPETVPKRPPRAEASPPQPITTQPASLFSVNGMPMITETKSLPQCDATSWLPEQMMPQDAPGQLLHLDRSPGEATAIWLEGEPATYHTAHLVCWPNGRGEQSHSWMTGPIGRVLEGQPAEITVERSGPVPLLEGTIQLLQFRNLGWLLYLDEPSEPATGVQQLEAILHERGWRTRPTPPPRLLPPGTPGLLESKVLVRGQGVCLLHRMRTKEAPNLLLTACHGVF